MNKNANGGVEKGTKKSKSVAFGEKDVQVFEKVTVPAVAALSTSDSFSHSNWTDVKVVWMILKWTFDIVDGSLCGEVILQVEQVTELKTELSLDIRDLTIAKVTNHVTGQSLRFNISEETDYLGNELKIFLSEKFNKYKKARISILYKKMNQSGLFAENFLDDEADGDPLVFRESDYFLSRCLFPCQDSLGNKIAFKAYLKINKSFDVLMSGQFVEKKQHGNYEYYHFECLKPVPVSAIGFAAGKFTCTPLSDTVNLYSLKNATFSEGYMDIIKRIPFYKDELHKLLPENVFSQNLNILIKSKDAENSTCKFANLICLPNNLDTKLEQNIVTALTNIWFCQLVTPINGNHFWLQESFSLFFIRKLLGKQQGERTKELKMRHLKLNKSNLKDKWLRFSKILYQFKVQPRYALMKNVKNLRNLSWEKGFVFLFMLDHLLGPNGEFEQFLKEYVDQFKYKTVETDDFLKYLQMYFEENEQFKSVDPKIWLQEVGTFDRNIRHLFREMKYFRMEALINSLLEINKRCAASVPLPENILFISCPNDCEFKTDGKQNGITEISNESVEIDSEYKKYLSYLTPYHLNHRARRFELIKKLQNEHSYYAPRFLRFLQSELDIYMRDDLELNFVFLLFCIRNRLNSCLKDAEVLIKKCDDFEKLNNIGFEIVEWDIENETNMKACDDTHKKERMKLFKMINQKLENIADDLDSNHGNAG